MIQQHEIEQGTEAWHDARRGKFTGSNAYKLLSSLGATEYAKAVTESFQGNYFTKRGHILEDEAVELYEAIHRTTVSRPGYVTNSKYPDCLYSPDGIDGDCLIEVKCFGAVPHMKIYNGDIPLKILAQIHFGLLICELPRARLVIYNPELPDREALKLIDIRANRDIQRNFKKILKGYI